jgi:hypothetical protein
MCLGDDISENAHHQPPKAASSFGYDALKFSERQDNRESIQKMVRDFLFGPVLYHLNNSWEADARPPARTPDVSRASQSLPPFSS